jgi:signal transduction histidine kinase
VKLSGSLPATIRGRTILLLLAIAVLLTAINVSIILSRPLPREAPLDTREIARLLDGEPIAKVNADVAFTRTAAPRFQSANRLDVLTAFALARDLHTPVQNVRFERVGETRENLAFIGREVDRSLQVYGPGKFEAIVPHGFRAAVKLPDGQWQVMWRTNVDEVSSWRFGIIIRFIISLALMLPIGWLFARWLTEPIQAFGEAAERLGRQRRVESVEVRGPTEVRQAAEALNDMQDRIRRYVLERTSVVGAIAHDLRTPLSRIKFHLASAPDSLRRTIEGEIDEMERMISATLDFAETETRPPAREPLHLTSLLEGVVDDASDCQQAVRIDVSEEAIVVGDALLLKRLFSNLIINAVKYGERATISVRRSDGNAVIDIEDEGPGLNDASLERAFEPFYRAESSRNRATGGIGLGLAIVQSAARSHGGEVELSNRSEGGLRARVWLPLCKTDC